MNVVSTFSGIGGIDLGLERAGMTTIAQVEINPFCLKVLAHRWPTVERCTDIKEFGVVQLAERRVARERGRADERGDDGAARIPDAGGPHVDILTGGFPCQDLSVAGRRAGLTGARSGLFYEFVRVAQELQPTWLLLENVPGLLSSNDGRDFAVVLGELGAAGYFVEWRVLDSRWFGVPQRRRRVFLVGHLGGPSPVPVLFESEGRGGHPQTSEPARENIAHSLRARPNASLREDSDTYIPSIGRALTATMGKHRDPGMGVYEELAPTSDASAPHIVAHTLRASGFDASKDGTGRGTPMVVESVALRGRDGGATAELGGDQAHALRSSQGGGDKAHILAYRKSARVNADPNSPETWVDDGIANTLNSFDVGDVRTTHAIVGISENQRGEVRETDYSRQLTSGGGKPGQGYGAVRIESSVRRLTPTECERLQGFPDGWTCLEDWGAGAYDSLACRCPDGPRYAALGNAVTVNVAHWIGRRMMLAHAASEEVS